jgi:hypothetical protein
MSKGWYVMVDSVFNVDAKLRGGFVEQILRVACA